MPAGRPTLYEDRFCEELIAHMAEGFTFESFAGVVGVTRDTLYNWQNQHAEFLDAHKIGTEKSLLEHERKLNKIMDGGDGSVPAILFALKARHKWRDGDVKVIVAPGHNPGSERRKILAQKSADEMLRTVAAQQKLLPPPGKDDDD